MPPRVWIAEPDEAEPVARLLAEFRTWYGKDWPSDNAFHATVERLIEQRDTEYLLGAPHDDAPPCGVAQLRFRHGLWRAGGDCLLEDLFVTAQARWAGLGRALVRASIDRARERGCRRVELDVSETNTAALHLYATVGFEVPPPGERDLYLRLHLDNG